MKRLKTILLFDSSKYIHLALVSVLYLLAYTSYLAIILLVIELAFLFKKSRNLLIYSFLLMAILNLRLPVYNSEEKINSGKIIEIEDNRIKLANKGHYYLYYDNTTNLEIGMEIIFVGERIISDQKNVIFGFDYQRYLKANSIKGQYKVLELDVTQEKFVLQKIPDRISKYFENTYDSDIASYLKLFILGNKESLDEDIISNSRKIGISHLFAVSGMHLSLILMGINTVIKKLFLSTRTKNIIIISCLIFYNIITGFSISILRASMLSVCLLIRSDKNFSNTDYLTFIMMAFLIYNPYFIYNVGFALSFLISFSIILGRDIFQSSNNTLQVLKIGALANLVSLPIIMNLNGSFGIMNILYNVIFVYFVSYILLPMAFIILIVPIMEVYHFFIGIFEELIVFTTKLNLYLEFYFSFVWLQYLYYLCLLGFLVFFKVDKKKYFAVGCALSVFLVWNYYKIFPSTFVRMIDVNQAEAIHIHHNACDILIDTGKADDYNSVINYFKHNNINDIDYLVITHFHEDHYGEAMDLINSIEVESILVNQVSEEMTGLNQTVVKVGDWFGCGDIILENLNEYHSDNENNNSLVLYGKIGIDYWLFTGDIEMGVEEAIINSYNFEVDVLKVAHHGSNSSSTEVFLDRFNIDYALISVGENNYSHPSKDVIDRFEARKYRVFRTDEVGTITFHYLEVFDFRIIENYYFEKRRAYYF